MKLGPPPGIDDFSQWMEAFFQPLTLVDFGILLVCAALSWGLCRGLRNALALQGPSIFFGRRTWDGVLFPFVLLSTVYASKLALAPWLPLVALRVAIPALVVLVLIRIGVKVLQVAFRTSPAVRLLERTLSWAAWLLMVLWVSGFLPLFLNELDQIRWTFGSETLSLRKILEGFLTAGAVMIVTLWISSVIEDRLLRNATGSELSVRKALSNANRAILVFIGLLLALSSVGIDMSALSVLGGAIGVGIGFGLQKLAANYVSGFVILAERSLRIGDNVKVDGFEGRITNINARYAVIRSLSGSESIVPNEMLITSRVENLSLADPLIWQSTSVTVGYDSDVTLVMNLLQEAALSQPRVLREPAPSAALAAFAADGLQFTLGYWIADPQNGQLNLRSMINLAILRALQARQIEIPYPQRVIRAVREESVPQPSAHE
ncbi:MAG: mechanosensitive ion channel [Burkholderiaceae bacterium]|nr:mechanosensitive ion channel [Burkholderiaceae bacterium]